jgi:hypothetical protein
VCVRARCRRRRCFARAAPAEKQRERGGIGAAPKRQMAPKKKLGQILIKLVSQAQTGFFYVVRVLARYLAPHTM